MSGSPSGPADPPPQGLRVACLCAAWCGTCRGYRDVFVQVARAHPGLRFVWVDIEEHGDALAPFDLDIENFPTVAITRDGEFLFLGTLLPHAATLSRTVQAALEGGLRQHGSEKLPAGLAQLLDAVGEPVTVDA